MRTLVVVLALAALAGGCASKGVAIEVKAGPGVSRGTIALGVLTDQSGPFKPFGEARTKGYELFLSEVNARGGVCGRRIELMVRDHGYNVQRALDAYFEIEPNVLGFIDITGSPMTDAIEPDLMQTRALAAPGGWSAELLGNPHMMVVGATYDLEAINGLDYFRRTGVIKDGETIGHLYLEGSYGGNAFEGTTFAAGQWGMKLVGQSIKETTTDLTAQIVALKTAGAKAVMLNTSPSQTAVAVATAAKIGWNVPFMSSPVGFDPAIMASPAAEAVQRQLTVVSPIAPVAADEPGPRAVAEAFRAKYPNDKPSGMTNHGYVVAMAFVAVMEKACGVKDLTRDGMLRAFNDTNGIDTGGLTGPLRFSLAGRPSATQCYILKPDPAVTGALSVVEKLSEADLVKLKATKAK